MTKLAKVKTKICTACKEEKPLDAEHWRRNKRSSDGFYTLCKPCSKKEVKDHYRKWNKRDIDRRGEVGVRCVLWSPRCGICPCIQGDLSACWRLAKIKPDGESYPVELE